MNIACRKKIPQMMPTVSEFCELSQSEIASPAGPGVPGNIHASIPSIHTEEPA